MWKPDGSWSADSVDLLQAVMEIGPDVDILEARVLHGSYRWDAPEGIDQTRGVAECACEIVARKRWPVELERGGRLR
jgi:hypothetical protein